MIHEKPLQLDIVIPVHNEGQNIVSVLRAFEREVHAGFRVLIGYDRDDDSTLDAVRSLDLSYKVVFIKNEGLFAHGAIMTCFRASSAPAVISYMADDDYNAALIDRMLTAFENGCDVVCPSRFMRGGSMVGCRPQKALLVRAVALTLHTVARLPVHDPTNAFRLFSRRLLDRVQIQSRTGFAYSLELLAKCHRLGWPISEIPSRWFERKAGKSRFLILPWAIAYLRWYFYVFATTFLPKSCLRLPPMPPLGPSR